MEKEINFFFISGLESQIKMKQIIFKQEWNFIHEPAVQILNDRKFYEMQNGDSSAADLRRFSSTERFPPGFPQRAA